MGKKRNLMVIKFFIMNFYGCISFATLLIINSCTKFQTDTTPMNFFPSTKNEVYSNSFKDTAKDETKGKCLIKNLNDTLIIFFYPLDNVEFVKSIYYSKKKFDEVDLNSYFKKLDKNYIDSLSKLIINSQNDQISYEVIRTPHAIV